jgi:hypothetical protein
MKYGYARVSTDDQTPALQLAALKKAGCRTIFKDDGLSGATTKRPALLRCLKKLEHGDMLIVWKLDRLGRSLRDLITMLDDLKHRGVKFRSLTEAIDTETPTGRAIVKQKTSELFITIRNLSEEIANSGNIPNQFASDDRQCHLRNNRISLIVTLSFSEYDLHSMPELKVREFDKRLAFLGERLFYPDGEPRELRATTFLPEINRAGEYGWKKNVEDPPFVSSQELAKEIVIEFVDLVEKADREDFRPPPRRTRVRRSGF